MPLGIALKTGYQSDEIHASVIHTVSRARQLKCDGNDLVKMYLTLKSEIAILH